MGNKRKKKSFGRRRREVNVQQNRIEVEENADTVPQKTIVDINNDCLERVFEHLDFRDLIHVAEANKHLGVAAEAVFVRKLKRRLIAVKIGRSLLAFRAIRLFGQSVSAIHLKIKRKFLREKFFVHVNEYCRKTLNTFRIFGNDSNIFGAAKHRFENFEEFSSSEGKLGPGCEHFKRLFPRLRQLTFIDNDIVEPKYIHKTFPHLAFTFEYSFNLEPPKLLKLNMSGIDFQRIASLNPHIQSIALNGYLNPSIWEVLNTELKNLKSISICYSPKHVVCYNSLIRFNNVEIFDVLCKLDYSKVTPKNVFSFKRLKNMKVRCYKNQLEGWLDFILAHPTIEVLVIDLTWMDEYQTCLENLHHKLNRVRQNTQFITLQMDYFEYFGEEGDKSDMLGLKKYLEAQKWFDRFSVVFSGHEFAEVDDLMENTPRIKNYEIKKYNLIEKPYVDFDKRE
ncbi:uncharacterized protein LOC129565772 isoform X2 [Sitodiplosis mosellana]|uniref:uncharacterized protein LOC129565772 isoform X2 n=1 Tax=Sitodiplosis mosellana TaxID=263140 RepID=UPI0024449AF1|nr:uncharacterized protein LOC129565772 isoform X2 [Sitodiplosis mosellana]